MDEEQKDQLNSDTLVAALRLILNRGRTEVKRVGSQGKHQLNVRSLKKDRSKMYEKLGKEVEQLILSGELVHPSLQRGFDRLQELHTTISQEEEL
jgi:hypothetical protein